MQSLKLKIRSYSPWLGLLGAGLISFQGCNPLESKSSSDGSVLHVQTSNGEGYSGMIYVNRADNACSDGSSVETKISVYTKSQQAFVTRENCSDISPKSVDYRSLDLMPHNLANLVYGSRVFDEGLSSSDYTSLFCRGKSTDPTTGKVQVVDAVVKESLGSQSKTTGRVILGVYDAAVNLIQKYDMGEVPLGPPTVIGGHILYNSLTLERSEVFTLDYLPSENTATLTYVGNLAQPGELPTEQNKFYTVPGLHCYRQ
jgi:hypothetical protein